LEALAISLGRADEFPGDDSDGAAATATETSDSTTTTVTTRCKKPAGKTRWIFRALRFGRRKTRPRQRELGAEPEPALPMRPPTTVLWSRSQGRMEEGGELGLGLGFVWEGECVWVSERGAPGA
jgi:hypothetical protein